MSHFADRLAERIAQTGNPTVLGLDPLLSYIPADLLDWFREQCDDPALATGLALFDFNRRLIDNTADLIPAVKLQLACYEQYGVHGLDAFCRTIDYARQQGLLVIADGKRNDIGSTAAAYARAYLGQTDLLDGSGYAAFAADALTVNGYLGSDGIEPFLIQCRLNGKGIFILVRTSNPSAGDLQDLPLQDGRTVCMAMADLVNAWGAEQVGACGYSAVGAVVGATWPQQALELRRRMPHTFILVPGYGSQGATAADAAASFAADGTGALVNASRSLMCAWSRHGMSADQFDLAARREALRMKADLNQALEQRGKGEV
jgi:orotidine-5'-phosphate decarboxylase